VIWGVPGGYPKVFRAFSQGECRAAVFRSNFYKKRLTPADKTGLKVLFKSKPLPNQAISVSRRIKQEDKPKIIRSLTLGAGKKATQPISKRFAGDQAFTAARNDEYVSHNLLLEGVIYGW
jgi:ABC-type phosphate/phosphonate transport system substrate-binding protein